MASCSVGHTAARGQLEGLDRRRPLPGLAVTHKPISGKVTPAPHQIRTARSSWGPAVGSVGVIRGWGGGGRGMRCLAGAGTPPAPRGCLDPPRWHPGPSRAWVWLQTCHSRSCPLPRPPKDKNTLPWGGGQALHWASPALTAPCDPRLRGRRRAARGGPAGCPEETPLLRGVGRGLSRRGLPASGQMPFAQQVPGKTSSWEESGGRGPLARPGAGPRLLNKHRVTPANGARPLGPSQAPRPPTAPRPPCRERLTKGQLPARWERPWARLLCSPPEQLAVRIPELRGPRGCWCSGLVCPRSDSQRPPAWTRPSSRAAWPGPRKPLAAVSVAICSGCS